MLDMNEVKTAIEELKAQRTTFSQIEKLALLYVVQDHNRDDVQPVRAYSHADTPGSEFIQAASGVDVSKLLQILDEHFNAIKVLYPKEYAQIIRKIVAAGDG